MRAAIIENGVVVNVIEVPSVEDVPGCIACDAWVGIGHVYTGGVFGEAPKTLEETKTLKLTQITRDRDAQIAQPVTVHGLPWQADEVSQRNLSNEILTASAGVFLTPVWRDANNNNMTITDIQQLVDIAAAMKLQTLTSYQTSWARKAAVEAATTVPEVQAI